jgi:hypothetical protein
MWGDGSFSGTESRFSAAHSMLRFQLAVDKPMARRQDLALRGLIPDGGAAPTLNDELRRR